jgi:4-alpha-glucanotransferase
MNDATVHALAQRAGIAVEWRDYANKPHRVPTDTIKRILAALELPCETAQDIAHSQEQLAKVQRAPLITAAVGMPIEIPVAADKNQHRAKLTHEAGDVSEMTPQATSEGVRLQGIATPGYHVLEFGDQRVTLAVAPERCLTIPDLTPGQRMWGLAAQIYGLRSAGDCGVGDLGGVVALAQSAAAMKADALLLSPLHALFAADPSQFSPYSPSSRLFYNPLHADARLLFGAARVQKAACEAGLEKQASELEQQKLIDWPQAAHTKMAVLRRLFDDFRATDLAAAQASSLAADFAQYRAAGGRLLEDHARFEALHAARLSEDGNAWSWRDWPAPYRDPQNADVERFAADQAHDVAFHSFLQWIADRSLAAAQREAREAGMRIGLIADVAVGMSSAGSHAWTSQTDILGGLEIGAPPDLYNTRGQNWGLTTFSPRALATGGFAPFIATLRACLRHAGGVRIDHVMGLLRLWVVPRGADPNEGAYLAFPIDDMLRLIALESYRHRAIVIGEDLGTVPVGFRERLQETGIYGMRVLLFERTRNRFTPPQTWTADTAAMTSTHDLPTVAGWWRGADIDTRAALGVVQDAESEQAARQKDRQVLWRAFRRAKAGEGDIPCPEQTKPVADAAMKFMAQTTSDLALVPLEDALGLEEQANLPGTILEHPNWRRRYAGDAATLLGSDAVRHRLAPLVTRDKR